MLIARESTLHAQLRPSLRIEFASEDDIELNEREELDLTGRHPLRRIEINPDARERDRDKCGVARSIRPRKQTN